MHTTSRMWRLALATTLLFAVAATPTVLFEDTFSRREDQLGARWTEVSGLWLTDGTRAVSDLDGSNLATVTGVTCRDCRVQARLVGFGVAETGLLLRANGSPSSTRYDAVVLSNGRLRIRRWVNGVATTLAEGPSGVPDLDEFSTFVFSASGGEQATEAVTLSVSINGTPRLTATDSSAQRIRQPGLTGLWTSHAGVWFDDFQLDGISGTTTPPPPPPPPTDPPPTTGTSLFLDVVHQVSGVNVMAVTPSGLALAIQSGSPASRLFVSRDNARTWSSLSSHPLGASFRQMACLSDGTLIADVLRSGRHALSLSTNGGANWSDVLDLGAYRMLTPRSVAQLGNEIFMLEYQDFTTGDTSLRLHVSINGGRTWTVRQTFQGHRHGHGLSADPATGALWAFFGDTDSQAGLYRSMDGGRSWTALVRAQPGDLINGIPLSGGGLLFGQDISYLPPRPAIVRVDSSGRLTTLRAISGPAYSTFALGGGGYVVGAARESGGDIYPPGEESARVYASVDGVSWREALAYRRISSGSTGRADVYWELPSGELVLQLLEVQAVAPSGVGYQILRPSRR